MGCSPQIGAEERLSVARLQRRSTHVFCTLCVTVHLLSHSPSLRGTPENVVLNTSTLEGSQWELQKTPRPASVHFAEGTGHMLPLPLTFHAAFSLLVICNIFSDLSGLPKISSLQFVKVSALNPKKCQSWSWLITTLPEERALSSELSHTIQLLASE